MTAMPAPDPIHGLKEACDKLLDLRERKEALDKESKRLGAQVNELAYQVIPELMRVAGLTQIRRHDGVLFYLTSFVRARIRGEHDQSFKEWLRDRGFGDLIKEMIPHQTLTAWYRELDDLGELPDDVRVFLDVDEGTYATIKRGR